MRHLAPRPVSRTLPRVLLAVVMLSLVGVLTLVALVLVGVLGSPQAEPPPASYAAAAPPSAPHPTERSERSPAPEKQTASVTGRARALLQDWDRAREQAWRAEDPVALRALYVPTSTAAARDSRMLRRWRDRGLRLTRLRMHLAHLAVTHREPGLLALRVTDRLTDAVVVRRGAGARAEPIALPRDQATVHRLVLRRSGGRWRMASVS